MSTVANEMLEDAAEFLDGRVDELLSFLDDVAALGDAAPPTPSAELARLLAGTPAVRQVRPVRRPLVPRPVRVRRRVAGLAAAAVAGLSVTGAAAMANELPAPMQRVVAHLSEDYLPFAFPRPVGDPPAGRVRVSPGSHSQGEEPAVTTTPGRPAASAASDASGASPRPGGPVRGRSATSGQRDWSVTVPRGWSPGQTSSPGSGFGPEAPAGGQQTGDGTQATPGSAADVQGTAPVVDASAAGIQGSSAATDPETGSVTASPTTPEDDAYAGSDDAGRDTKGRPSGTESGTGPGAPPDPVPPATGRASTPGATPGPGAGRPDRFTFQDPPARSSVPQAPAPAPTPADTSSSATATDGASPAAG